MDNTVGRYANYIMDSFEVRAKRKHRLTGFQKSVIVGTILGDGHLLRTTRGYCLRLNHGIQQKLFVDWKYDALREIAMPQKVYKNSYHFRTVSHPKMIEYRKLFYRGRTKKIPERWLRSVMNPVVFAVWIMDDGTNELGTSRCLRINTQCFSLRDHFKLQRILKSKFGITTTLNRDKGKYRLRVRKDDMPLLRNLIDHYIIPTMYYKISP